MASPIINAITILLFIGLLAWIIYLGYWFLKIIGFWKKIKFGSLKRKFRDYEFKDDILDWCIKKKLQGWNYYEIKRFVKYESDKQERLYTYLMILKLTKQELEEIERGFKENEKEITKSKGIEGEISQSYEETQKEEEVQSISKEEISQPIEKTPIEEIQPVKQTEYVDLAEPKTLNPTEPELPEPPEPPEPELTKEDLENIQKFQVEIERLQNDGVFRAELLFAIRNLTLVLGKIFEEETEDES